MNKLNNNKLANKLTIQVNRNGSFDFSLKNDKKE